MDRKTPTETPPVTPVVTGVVPKAPIRFMKEPEDGGPEFPDKPVEFYSPDLEYQIAFPFDQAGQEELRKTIQTALPGADVRFASKDGFTRVGVWRQGTNYPEVQKLRDKGVEKINFPITSIIGVQADAPLLSKLVDEAWEKIPKRRTPEGWISKTGSVHLTSLVMQLLPPNKIVLKIEGFDDRTTPDTDFKLTNINTLSIVSGAIRTEANNLISTDTSALNWLTGFFGFVFPPLSLWTLLQSVSAGSATAPSGATGNLGDLLRIFPAGMTMGDFNMTFLYDSVEVSTAGIRAVASNLSSVKRNPSVAITGSRKRIVKNTNPCAEFTLTAVPTDLLPRSSPPPLKVKWTAPGGSVVSPANLQTKITYELPTPAQTTQKTVTVEVTDAQTTVSASATLTIEVTKQIGKENPKE